MLNGMRLTSAYAQEHADGEIVVAPRFKRNNSGELDMADHGKKDSKKETKKKALLTPKEKRQLKKDKKNKAPAV